MIKIDVSASVPPAEIDSEELWADWQEDLYHTQNMGDAWLAGGGSAY